MKKTKTEMVRFEFNKDIEKNVDDLLNSEKAEGFKLISSFCPPVVDKKIYVVFVLQKEQEILPEERDT